MPLNFYSASSQDFVSFAGRLPWSGSGFKHNIRLPPPGFGGFFVVSGERWVRCRPLERCGGGGWNGRASLSPRRCKWVPVKEGPLLQTETWPRHRPAAPSAFNLREPSLFKWHRS